MGEELAARAPWLQAAVRMRQKHDEENYDDSFNLVSFVVLGGCVSAVLLAAMGLVSSLLLPCSIPSACCSR